MTIEFLQETFSEFVQAGQTLIYLMVFGLITTEVRCLFQCGYCNYADARTILVQPWENRCKSCGEGNYGFGCWYNAENNGEVIRLGIPPLTEERRKQLQKQLSRRLKMLK